MGFNITMEEFFPQSEIVILILWEWLEENLILITQRAIVYKLIIGMFLVVQQIFRIFFSLIKFYFLGAVLMNHVLLQ